MEFMIQRQSKNCAQEADCLWPDYEFDLYLMNCEKPIDIESIYKKQIIADSGISVWVWCINVDSVKELLELVVLAKDEILIVPPKRHSFLAKNKLWLLTIYDSYFD
jgi:hypothetical protein